MFCSTDAIATMLISKTFFSLSATVSKYGEKGDRKGIKLFQNITIPTQNGISFNQFLS